jgi:hypothetical protein
LEGALLFPRDDALRRQVAGAIAAVPNGIMFVFIDARCSTFRCDTRGPGVWRRQQLQHFFPRRLPHSFRISQAAAARIVGKPDVVQAAQSGNLELVKDHVSADAGCVHKTNGWKYDCLLRARAAPAQVSIFLISVIRTALTESCYCGHLEITRFLVESGANLEARDYK